MNKIDELKKMINESNYIVCFTGAGVSTESGLKDFRSKDGLYNQKNKYGYEPEYLLSHDCFINHQEEFFEYYKDNLNSLNIKPNIVHNYLKTLEDKNKLKAIITQNIDGLHTIAGSKNVYEVHGTTYSNHCIKCNKQFDANYVFNSKGVPYCTCGGIIKPDVVLYGEMLPEEAFNNSINEIQKADMLLILGSSLTVYPASGLINYFNGKYLVIINKDTTLFDKRANLVINDTLSNVFNELTED